MKFEKIFWGLLLILIAIFILVNPMGYLTGISITKILLGVMLLIWFIRSIFKLHFSGALFSAAFFCIVFSTELELTSITPWPVLLAALLGSIGLHYMFPHTSCHFRRHKNNFNTFTSTDTEDNFIIDVSFGENIKYISAKNFTNGNIDCAFGSVKLYLDNTTLSKDGATINIDASFSGLELYVPKNWNVINKLTNTLSGVEEKNKSHNVSDDISNSLILKGSLSFSGVTIIYL